MEREGVAAMKGNPVTLLGPELKQGDDAPNCTLIGNDLSEVELSSFKGKTTIVSVVPSLDTPVCDLQTKRFNQEAGNLGDVAVVTISRDLPFAQKRWCGATDSNNVVTLSDFQSGAFGEAWGVKIKGLGLLARAVFVVDPEGNITYTQICPEITEEPNYDEVLDAVKALQSAQNKEEVYGLFIT